MTIFIIAAVVALVGSALAAVAANREVRIDQLSAGAWILPQQSRDRVMSADLSSMIVRLDRARTDPHAWETLLRRLDGLHAQLSPFGENVRRPPYQKQWWWEAELQRFGVKLPEPLRRTDVEPEAPKRYNARYLESYIQTLERLAGVPNEHD